MKHRKVGLAAIFTALPLLLAVSAGAAGTGALAGIGAWTYQLQNIDIDALASVAPELLVVDYSRDGTAANAFSATDVARLKTMPDGRQRVVLAYLSVGEAENYRFYWKPEWVDAGPSWLLGENPEWRGNFDIRYWDTAWQDIIFGEGGSYLEAIQQAGFDGVYLDRVDAFERRDAQLSLAARRGEMISLVRRLAAIARERNPDFIVVAQNGEELLSDPDYRAVIDALAKEDLLYGLTGDGRRNGNGEIRASLNLIMPLLADGKRVFLVEYLSSQSSIAQARDDAASLGMPLFIGGRELNHATSR